MEKQYRLRKNGQFRYVYKKGKFRDLTVVGILKSDYYALIEKKHYWDE